MEPEINTEDFDKLHALVGEIGAIAVAHGWPLAVIVGAPTDAEHVAYTSATHITPEMHGFLCKHLQSGAATLHAASLIMLGNEEKIPAHLVQTVVDGPGPAEETAPQG